MAQFVYSFDQFGTDAASYDLNLLGQKGASISLMNTLGLPVPPGFTISVPACAHYFGAADFPPGLAGQVDMAIQRLERASGLGFGNPGRPLRVAVRPGAPRSLPRMAILDTVLDVESTADLWGAIRACYDLWLTPEAEYVRRHFGISTELGPAVTIQHMVYGNRPFSGTGFCFSRDLKSGKKKLDLMFFPGAHGLKVLEDHALQSINEREFRRLAPEAHQQMIRALSVLEREFRDAVELDIIVKDGQVWMMQSRPPKRTARAGFQVVVNLVGEGLIAEDEAIRRLPTSALDEVLRPAFEEGVERGAQVLGRGMSASSGVAFGIPVFSIEEAAPLLRQGKPVILVLARNTEVDPDEFRGITGILTTYGGMTSQPALVARSFGIPCVTGIVNMRKAREGKYLAFGKTYVPRGHAVSINGNTGTIYVGALPIAELNPGKNRNLRRVLRWADQLRTLEVRAEVASATEITEALRLGADGIAFVATERMFLDPDGRAALGQIAGIEDPDERRSVLTPLIPRHQQIFTEMQLHALLGAVAALRSSGRELEVEVLFPVMGFPEEAAADMECLNRVREEILGPNAEISTGLCIESPVGALQAHLMFPNLSRVLFDTGRMTGFGYGFQPDPRLVGLLSQAGMLSSDPFVACANDGFLQLLGISMHNFNIDHPETQIGVTGSQTTTVAPLVTFQDVGVKFVTSPVRAVPGTRLLAGQAAVRSDRMSS